MPDVQFYDKTETLKNGVAVRIRSIKPDDKQRLWEAFHNLQSESVYTRFFHHKKSLTAEELAAATEVDFDSVVALVVTRAAEGREAIIGGGRYAAYQDGGVRVAEVAFTVEEDYHGHGIAGLLLRHLAAIARQAGVAQFRAEVLSDNKAMLRVFARSGLPMKKKTEGGVAHVDLALTDPRPA